MPTSCYLPDDVSLTGDSEYAQVQRAVRSLRLPARTFEAWKRAQGAAGPMDLLWLFMEGGGKVLAADGQVRPRRLLVYHGHCQDGFGAAWAVRRLVGEDVEFRAATYGEPPVTVDEVRDRDVLFVDFAYDREVLVRLRQAAGNLWVMDHHATARTDLEGLPWCAVDLKRSGAGLAWDHLAPLLAQWVDGSPLPRPWIVDYVEDRDLWRFALPCSREVNAYLGTLPFDFATWDDAYGNLVYSNDLLEDPQTWSATVAGRAVLAGVRRYVGEMRDQSAVGMLAGHVVPCVNAPEVYISELLSELAQGQSFAVGYFRRGDGLWKYSLRSDERGLDVSQIARQFGGGGHPHAAGFQAAEPVDLGLQPRPRLALVR